MDKLCYSTNEEHFVDGGSTRQAALEEAVENSVRGCTVWTGVAKPLDLDKLARGYTDKIIENIEEKLFDLVGAEVSEGQPKYTGEDLRNLDSQLTAVIKNWLEGRITCELVEQVVEHGPEETNAIHDRNEAEMKKFIMENPL